jgi:hypothetical protein
VIDYDFYRAKATRLRRRAYRAMLATLVKQAQKVMRAIWQMNLIREPMSPIVAAEACVQRYATVPDRRISQ